MHEQLFIARTRHAALTREVVNSSGVMGRSLAESS
jgi:hypothetical protein